MTFLVHPEPDPVHLPGDPLGRSYTPDHVADAIVARIARRGWPLSTVWEPCVGGGAFLRAARAHGARWLIGTDLDPGAPGRTLCDEGLVVREWSDGVVNLQVFLDGSNDAEVAKALGAEGQSTVWMTSVPQGNGPKEWRRPTA